MGQIFIRRGTPADTEAFIRLLAEVRQGMTNKEWFYLDPPEDVREMMESGVMTLWVAMDGEKLAGAFDSLTPGLEAYNYGYQLGFSQEDLQKVINMDTAAVHPDYRGQHLQRRLLQAAEAELSGSGEKHLLCTIHPDNIYSLQNALAQGYTIQKTLPMYGSVRHILRKDIF